MAASKEPGHNFLYMIWDRFMHWLEPVLGTTRITTKVYEILYYYLRAELHPALVIKVILTILQYFHTGFCSLLQLIYT